MKPDEQLYNLKARDFAQYRWDYNPEAIAAVWSAAGLQRGSVIADIGAGTGLVGAHFVVRGAEVIGVEPDGEMRQEAVSRLGHFQNFHIQPGFSHATGIASESIDLITAGRALHWFDPVPTRQEFQRILKPGGWLAVLQIPTADLDLKNALTRLHVPETGWKTALNKAQLFQDTLDIYFAGPADLSMAFPGQAGETWEMFLGRVSSLSPAPNPGETGYPYFVSIARQIFDERAVDGVLWIKNITEVHLKRIKPV